MISYTLAPSAATRRQVANRGDAGSSQASIIVSTASSGSAVAVQNADLGLQTQSLNSSRSVTSKRFWGGSSPAVNQTSACLLIGSRHHDVAGAESSSGR